MTVTWEIIGLKEDEHSHACTAQEDGARQVLAFFIRDCSVDLHEANAGTKTVDGLDFYVFDGVRRFMEFMVWVRPLESEVGLEYFEPVLYFC